MLLAIGVQVEVARRKRSRGISRRFRRCFPVNVVVGAQDIEVLVVSEDQAALNELVGKRLAAVPGVRV